MAGFSTTLYRSVFRRTSTFTLAIVGAAFFFERAFDMTADYVFENANQGKLWKHIKDRYAQEE